VRGLRRARRAPEAKLPPVTSGLSDDPPAARAWSRRGRLPCLTACPDRVRPQAAAQTPRPLHDARPSGRRMGASGRRVAEAKLVVTVRQGDPIDKETEHAAALSFGPVAVAAAQTDPNDVESVDNPVDNNDNSGFDDWGLFGLLGLLGLAGLARRDRHPDRHVTTADRNTGSYSSTTR
jgi:hypothetical protein